MRKQKEFCFTKQQRLLEPNEFKRVYRTGKRIHGSVLTIIFSQTHHDFPRLGLAIAKKHLKHAVKRNLVKRLVREHYRLSCKTLKEYDIICASKPNLTHCSLIELKTDWQQIWQKLANT